MILKESKQTCNEKSTVTATIYSKLPLIEILLYYIGWISGIFYILYSVYLTSIEYQNTNQQLVDGWSFVGLKREATDSVIEIAYHYITYIILYGVLHYIIAEFLKHVCRKVLPYYYFLFSLSIIIFCSSYKSGIVVIVQALLSFTVAYFGNKFLVWSYGLTAITATLYFPEENLFKWCELHDSQIHLFMGVVTWNNLRYLTFALHINRKKETETITRTDFVEFLGYYFYFPTVCYGPLLLYDDFQNVYKTQCEEKFYNRLLKFIASIIKYTVYLHLTVLLLHFLHYGLLFQLNCIHISYSALHGLLWWAGFLFMLKYITLYGLAISAARAEGIRAPNAPKCIGRIALYSMMWKNFDQSLYWFNRRYIFEAFVNNSKSKIKQMMGSLLVFIFIIVWHAANWEIIVWASLNYVEVVLEELGNRLSKTKLFLKIYTNYLSPRYLRRIAALLSVPLLSLSCISQCFFLTSNGTALHYLKRIIQEHYVTNGFVLVIMYCACQVSLETKMQEENNKKTTHTKDN